MLHKATFVISIKESPFKRVEACFGLKMQDLHDSELNLESKPCTGKTLQRVCDGFKIENESAENPKCFLVLCRYRHSQMSRCWDR